MLFIVGSNNKYSFTNMIIEKILHKINTKSSNFQTKSICLKDLNINYCNGCLTCAKSGYCSIDEIDDFTIIRKELAESGIVFFASPVYFHSVPGIMKTEYQRQHI